MEQQLEAALNLTDDAPPLRVLPSQQLCFVGGPTLLRQSQANYQRLRTLHDPTAPPCRLPRPPGWCRWPGWCCPRSA